MKHVIVIGAGIVGAALADRLAPRCRVTLIDEDVPGQGATASSLAWINANTTLDETYLTFRVTAVREWVRLADEFGAPPWYVPNGNLMWADGDEAGAELSARVERLRSYDCPARFLTSADVTAIEPALRVPNGAHIAHFPGEAFAHGTQAAQALTSRARTAGARLITRSRVVALIQTRGRVSGVRLASGDEITADCILCSTGWQASRILASAGTDIPLMDANAPGSSAPGLIATTTPADVLRGLVHAPNVYLRTEWKGGLLLGASDLDEVTDMATPTATLEARAAELLARARDIVPALDVGVRIKALRRCIRPLPTDGYPLVGWSLPGLYVAVTHSAITLAPYLARLVVREVFDDIPSDELAPYRPDRVV